MGTRGTTFDVLLSRLLLGTFAETGDFLSLRELGLVAATSDLALAEQVAGRVVTLR